ncbi:MAG: hypothetical protein Q9162_001058 [Coniocarpon cinnabarinum]
MVGETFYWRREQARKLNQKLPPSAKLPSGALVSGDFEKEQREVLQISMQRISEKLHGDKKPKKDPPPSSAEAGSSQPETAHDKTMSPFVQLDSSEAENVHDITFEQAHQSLDAINEKARSLQ